MYTLKLDVGCGMRKLEGAIGVDYCRDSEADVIADAEHLPFRGETFESVHSQVLLEHLPNPFNGLKEQYRVLRKGGKLVCITDNASYYGWSLSPTYRHECIHEDHYCIFYPLNVIRMFRLLKLKKIRARFVYTPLGKLGRFFAFLCRLKLVKRDVLYNRFKVVGLK